MTEKTTYPTPKNIEQLVLEAYPQNVNQHGYSFYYNYSNEAYQQTTGKFFETLPDKDKTDKFIHYLFACLLGEPKHRCLFLSVSAGDDSCAAWIDVNPNDFNEEAINNAIDRLGKYRWDIQYHQPKQEDLVGRVCIGIDRLVASTSCERYKHRIREKFLAGKFRQPYPSMGWKDRWASLLAPDDEETRKLKKALGEAGYIVNFTPVHSGLSLRTGGRMYETEEAIMALIVESD